MQMRFQPIWDARREALTNFLVTPVDPRTAERVDGYHFEPHADAVRSYLELDELQLKASEEALKNLFGAGRKALVSVSIHVSSLQTTAALSQIFSILSGFDRKLAAYRIVRIVGIEPGFPRIYLEDICRTLMSRAQRIAFGIAWNEPDIASLLRLRPSAVGFLLPPSATSPWSSRADLIGRVRSAVEVCAPAPCSVLRRRQHQSGPGARDHRRAHEPARLAQDLAANNQRSGRREVGCRPAERRPPPGQRGLVSAKSSR